MTKEDFKRSVKQVLTDRQFVILGIFLLLACLIYMMVVGFSIHPRDVQVYTRYTAFGEAHFYKNPWQYMLLFVLFGALVTSVHLAIMVKLHSLGRRQSAIVVGWLAVFVLFVAAVYALSIMRLAFR